MTTKEFVTTLLRSNGVIQWREIDRCTTDYTLRKILKDENVIKSVWSGEKHSFGPEEHLTLDEAVSEIIGRVEKAKKTQTP